MPGPVPREWTDVELALLGTMPDIALASRLEVSRTAVTIQRNRRGITAYCGRGYRTAPFTTWLADTLEADGLTRAMAAKLFEVTSETLERWLSGTAVPSKLEKSGMASLLLRRRANTHHGPRTGHAPEIKHEHYLPR